jgi:hypothetical protein
MHKKFTFGLIALLGVSLFIMGCDDSSDDAEKSTTDLAKDLAEKLVNAKVDPANDTKVLLTGIVNLPTENITVAKGITLDTGAFTLAVADLTVNGTVNLGAAATPAGNVTVGASATLTVGQSGTLVIDTSAVISGTGKIITNGGAITIGGTAGYTAPTPGVAGDDIADAVTALAADVVKLTDKSTINLDTTFGGTSSTIPGIGSTAGEIDSGSSATLDIEADADGTDNAAAIALESTLVTGTLTSTAVSGTDSADIGATYTLSLSTKDLQITDGSAGTTTSKVGIVTFTGVKLANGGLVTPALPAFSVGVKTKR